MDINEIRHHLDQADLTDKSASAHRFQAAAGIVQLLDEGATQVALAEQLGRSRPYVQNYARVYREIEDIRKAIPDLDEQDNPFQVAYRYVQANPKNPRNNQPPVNNPEPRSAPQPNEPTRTAAEFQPPLNPNEVEIQNHIQEQIHEGQQQFHNAMNEMMNVKLTSMELVDDYVQESIDKIADARARVHNSISENDPELNEQFAIHMQSKINRAIEVLIGLRDDFDKLLPAIEVPNDPSSLLDL